MDIRLALMSGIDIPIPECQLIVHQPKLNEIALIGEKDYFIGAQCLCFEKNAMNIQDETLLTNTNNFQIFMTIMSEKETADKKASVLQVLSLLFPNTKVTFTPRSLLLDKTIIDESNFVQLQEILKLIFCVSSSISQEQGFNPANSAAQEIADKLMRGRQRVAKQNGQLDASILSQYASILTVGLNSMSLQSALNLTMYQLYDLIERYSLYMNWDLDARSKLAGGKPDSKPDNWMKNIH